MQSDERWFVGDSAGNLLSMDPTAAVEVVVETVDAASTVLDPTEHDESDRAVQVMARRPGSTNEVAIAFRNSISITFLDDVSSTVHYFASCSFLPITHIEFHCDGDLL
jgi:hypothetical protein